MMSKITGEEWRYGEVAHVLVSTPETIKPEWESESLHFVDDFIYKRLCVTVVPVELTDDDILKIERRVKAANEYAEMYYQKLINK
jgi:hypothetical protein